MIRVAVAEVPPEFMQECDRYWADAVQWGVRPGVGAQLPGEEKLDFTQDVKVRVFTPHSDKDLHHIVEVSFHGSLLDTCSVRCQRSHTKSICEYLYVWYRVRDPREVRGKGKPREETQQLLSGGGDGAGYARTDPDLRHPSLSICPDGVWRNA